MSAQHSRNSLDDLADMAVAAGHPDLARQASALSSLRETAVRSVYHADGAKPAVLVMFDPVPQFKDLDASRDNYETDGIAVARLLVHHLPGGTVDVVLRELLTYRASLLRVTFKEGA